MSRTPEPGLPDDCDFGRLFVQHQTQIYGYIRSLVSRSADAEDILQETASVLWRKFDSFKPGTSFLAWALQVARFQVMYARQKGNRSVLRFSDSFSELVAADTDAQSSRLANLREALDLCVHKLSAADLDMFERRYHADVTALDVARQLNKPPTTVYNALARIRRNLMECLVRALGSEGMP